MTELQKAKAALTPGTVWDVTNHYITREDHPCFGTRRRTILKVTGTSYTLSLDGDQYNPPMKWPKASQLTIHADGTLHFSNHPHVPGPFLTFTPVHN